MFIGHPGCGKTTELHQLLQKNGDTLLTFQETGYTGDIKLNMLKFIELQSRINENGIENVSENALQEAVTVWNKIYEYCNQKTVIWITEALAKIEEKLAVRELSANAFW